MGRIVGEHIWRELLRLQRLDELRWAVFWVITLAVSSSDCVVSRSAMGRIAGGHISRELLRLHRLEELHGPNCG